MKNLATILTSLVVCAPILVYSACLDESPLKESRFNLPVPQAAILRRAEIRPHLVGYAGQIDVLDGIVSGHPVSKNQVNSVLRSYEVARNYEEATLALLVSTGTPYGELEFPNPRVKLMYMIIKSSAEASPTAPGAVAFASALRSYIQESSGTPIRLEERIQLIAAYYCMFIDCLPLDEYRDIHEFFLRSFSVDGSPDSSSSEIPSEVICRRLIELHGEQMAPLFASVLRDTPAIIKTHITESTKDESLWLLPGSYALYYVEVSTDKAAARRELLVIESSWGDAGSQLPDSYLEFGARLRARDPIAHEEMRQSVLTVNHVVKRATHEDLMKLSRVYVRSVAAGE